MKRVKIGIIGAGRMGGNHVKELGSIPGVTVTGIADTDIVRAEKLITEHNLQAKAYSDYKEMLKTGLDAVSIVTPNFLHAEMAIDSANAGLDVLCEKPMAPTIAECNSMIKAAKNKKRILMINQSARYMAYARWIKKAVDSGEIGEVFHSRIIRFQTSAPNVDWSPGADWFVNRKAGGGMTNDIGVHIVDLTNWLFGKHKEVMGAARTLIKGNTADDNVTALIRYRNGTDVTMSLSWTAAHCKIHYEFYGTKGRIESDGSKIEVKYSGRKKDRIIEISKLRAPEKSYAHFIKCVCKREEPLTGGSEAKLAVEVLSMIPKK